MPSGSNVRSHDGLVWEQPPLYGDSGFREKCPGMMEQTHSGSHPGYPSKQYPSGKARIVLKDLLLPSPHGSETTASLVMLRSAKELIDHQIKLYTLFLPERQKNEQHVAKLHDPPAWENKQASCQSMLPHWNRSLASEVSYSSGSQPSAPVLDRWPCSAPRLPPPISAQQLWTAGLHFLQDFCLHAPEPLPKPPMI